MTIGFLHTSPQHVATFDMLVARAGQEPALHAVDEHLLARARATGPDTVRADLEAAVAALVARGARVVVCTCSTLGSVAEVCAPAGPGGTVPVLRVDRPAAERAGALARAAAGVVGAVVAVESSLGPTRQLLEAAAPNAEVVLAEGAWERFDAGDHEGYLAAVEQAVRALAPRVTVVLLAQASMAEAVDRVVDLAVPVLDTPRIAVQAAVSLAALP